MPQPLRRLILIPGVLILLSGHAGAEVRFAAPAGPFGPAAVDPVTPLARTPGEITPPGHLTHGPLVFGATDSSATIFCRAFPACEVAVEYSTHPDLDSSRVTAPILTRASDDWVAHIPLHDLSPRTTYSYVLRVNGNRADSLAPPSFHTFPDAADTTAFAFAIVADASNDPTDSAAPYTEIATLSPDFVVRLGDFDHRDPALISSPPDIDDWRTMHREVSFESTAGSRFADLIGRRSPVTTMWDDHDYGANNEDRTAPWRDLALRAFREYYPDYPPANPAGGNWYRFACGNSEFFVLDLRSRRDPDTDPDGPEKSMLDGDTIPDGQKDWLLNGLLDSPATWKFVLSTVPFNPTVVKEDAWESFQTERTEILDFIRTHAIPNVIVVSADLHTGGAIDDGTYAGLPEISVPHLNGPRVFPSGCAAEDCGLWSEGIFNGENDGGYGWVGVWNDRVELRTSFAAGAEEITYTVWNTR